MDDESEMGQEFSRVLRIALGTSMQASETLARKRQEQQGLEQRAAQERARLSAQQQAEAHRQLGWKLHDELRGRDLASMTTSQIADRMTVAAELAAQVPDASKAYMAGADRLRREFGVNVSEINQRFPDSAEQRRLALIHQLDDVLAAQRERDESRSVDLDAQQERREGDELQADRLDFISQEHERKAHGFEEHAEYEGVQAKQHEANEVADREQAPVVVRSSDAPQAVLAEQRRIAGAASARSRVGFPESARRSLGRGKPTRPARGAVGQQRGREAVSEVTR